jgi:hypothetical protein
MKTVQSDSGYLVDMQGAIAKIEPDTRRMFLDS